MTITLPDRPILLDHILKTQNKDVPLIAYPRGRSTADFELHTARELDLFVDRAAKYYQKQQKLADYGDSGNVIIAMVGPSDFDYLITQFALSRLGFGILLLSTRLSPEACLKLMKECGSSLVVQSPSALSFDLGARVSKIDSSIAMVQMATEDTYRSSNLDHLPFSVAAAARKPDEERQHDTALIYHSSGSTGFPKCIPTSHTVLLALIAPGKGTRSMTASPLFHAYAGKITINAMLAGKCMYLSNAMLPQTSDGLLDMCREAKPHNLWAVPYNLKLLAEAPGGLKALAAIDEVISSGSRLSDELGATLVQAGINIGILFAGTEPGVYGTSMGRPAGDKTWDYIRLLPMVQKSIIYKPLGGNTFEFVFLSSLPTLTMSNSNDPPGSFHSSDIFTPHPSIPNAWKFLGRADDRVTLSTGEKVLPLPIEGRIKEAPLVKEAVVFGIDRSLPGVLLCRADKAASMTDSEYIDAVWPAIGAANSESEAFARIIREMVIVLPQGTQMPTADKGNILRAGVYKSFAQEINAAYERFENVTDDQMPETLPEEPSELAPWLLRCCKDTIGLELEDETSDLFSAGLDSLRATQLRTLVNRVIARGSAKTTLTLGSIYAAGNVAGLANMINGLSNGTGMKEQNDSDTIFRTMQELVDKYSVLQKHEAGDEVKLQGKTVLLTGATGSLGAHLLSQLVEANDVVRVYCLVRGSEDPLDRVHQSLRTRGLSPNLSKVIALSADLSQPNLNLPPTTFSSIQASLTHIIHAAWPVNFQISLSAFEPQLLGLQHLLNLSLSTKAPRPAKLLFCSSVSVAMATQSPQTIPSAPIKSFSQALPSGYARSKLVAERIVEAAASKAGADARILRIGQVIGDTKNAIWNDTEAYPLVIRSALTLGVLPKLDENWSWLPVDTLAAAVLDVADVDADVDAASPESVVWNLQNPKTFHWTRDLLPMLSSSGMKFEAVEPNVWLQRLRKYSEETPPDEALKVNPAVKLLEYFEESFGGGRKGDQVTFDTERACRDSGNLRDAMDVIGEGLMGRIVGVWLEKWEGEGA